MRMRAMIRADISGSLVRVLGLDPSPLFLNWNEAEELQEELKNILLQRTFKEQHESKASDLSAGHPSQTTE